MKKLWLVLLVVFVPLTVSATTDEAFCLNPIDEFCLFVPALGSDDFDTETNFDGVQYWTKNLGLGGDFNFIATSTAVHLGNDGNWHLWLFYKGNGITSAWSFLPSGFTYGETINSFSVDGDTIISQKFQALNGVEMPIRNFGIAEGVPQSGPCTGICKIYAVVYTTDDLTYINTKTELYNFITANQFVDPFLNPLYGTSTSAFGGFNASTSLAEFQGQCANSGNIFSEGLCVAGAFLFIPNSETVARFSTLSTTLSTKFPFSYIYSVTDVWGELSASTTLNYQTVTIGLNSLGLGSTSPMGNFLPDISISSSTFTTYVPLSIWDALRNLASIAILLTLIMHIFFRSRDLLK